MIYQFCLCVCVSVRSTSVGEEENQTFFIWACKTFPSRTISGSRGLAVIVLLMLCILLEL